MKKVARLSDLDRRELFRNTADKMGLNDAIVEKDFWVCYTLDYLFHSSPWKDAITFKGGQFRYTVNGKTKKVKMRKCDCTFELLRKTLQLPIIKKIIETE